MWLKILENQGACVAQSFEHSALDFGSSHDLKVLGWRPALGSPISGESAWGFSVNGRRVNSQKMRVERQSNRCLLY